MTVKIEEIERVAAPGNVAIPPPRAKIFRPGIIDRDEALRRCDGASEMATGGCNKIYTTHVLMRCHGNGKAQYSRIGEAGSKKVKLLKRNYSIFEFAILTGVVRL